MREVLTQTVGGPLAKLDAARGSNAVADGNDHLKVVVVYEALHLPGTLRLNYSILSNSCLRRELAILVYRLDVVVDGPDADLV